VIEITAPKMKLFCLFCTLVQTALIDGSISHAMNINSIKNLNKKQSMSVDRNSCVKKRETRCSSVSERDDYTVT